MKKKRTKKPAKADKAPRKNFTAQDAKALVQTVAARHGIGQPEPPTPPADEAAAAERFEARTGLKVKRSWAMLATPNHSAAKKGEADPGKPGRGRLNRILGHSACAVAKSLGAAGVKWAEADRIMRAHGVQMPKPSLAVQLGFGRNEATWERRGFPAPLTATQIAELRAAGAKLESATEAA